MNPDTFEAFRQIALTFPGVIETSSYGTPSFKVNRKLLARLHEDGETLVLKMDLDARDIHMQMKPEIYYITDHYRKYPYVLVRLGVVDVEELREHLYAAWRANATKKLLHEYSKTMEPDTQ